MQRPLPSSPAPAPARPRRGLPAAHRLATSFLLAVLCAAGAGADVLVLRDGSRIETQGKWEQKGRQLIFKTAKGTLSALRASEVDLLASEKATADALAPKAPEVKAEVVKKPVLVLTDKDVKKAEPVPEPDGEAVDGAVGAVAPPAGGGKVVVVSSRIDAGDGPDSAFSVRGTVRNDSPSPVAEIKVMAVATVTLENTSRRVYCQTTLAAPLAIKASVDFACQVKRQDVLATGMAEAFGDAALSFEVQATPQAPPPPTDQKPNQS